MSKYTYYCPCNPYGLESLNSMGFREVDSLIDADFVILAGGEDISNHLYGEEAKGTQYTNSQRDTEEIMALGAARSLGKPVFGICRGAQLLHVMNGGRLIQHLREHNSYQHSMVKADTKEYVCEVNSLHHQGIPIDEAIQMYGADNVLINEDEASVEAFVDAKRKVFGVQYHPEFHECPEDARKFFQKLVHTYVRASYA